VSLNLVNFTDTLMGDITGNFTATLAAGANESWGYDYVTNVSDTDPLNNTAEAHYNITGLPNDINATDTVSIEVVTPGVNVTKTADNNITKAGDTVHFNITVRNTGNVSLNLVNFTDTLMGDITGNFSSPLAAGANQSWGYDYVTNVTDTDPLNNTAEAHYNITGLPNDINATDTVSIEVVTPGVNVTKTADNNITKAGDTVHFNITVRNTGNVSLNLVNFTDTLMGDITGNFSSPLAAGANQSWGYDYVTNVSDTDPLNNTAEAHYNITGLPNDINATDTVSIEV
ncbi:unnamed protein product, partial [marine sediment metagenome]